MTQDQIAIPISPGEMLDKITILEIKSERIEDIEKKANVSKELKMLLAIWDEKIKQDQTLTELREKLKRINEKLWDIEDDIRDEERNKRFGERFIELARSVYFTNDERAATKKDINLHLDSEIVEEKSYQDYQ